MRDTWQDWGIVEEQQTARFVSGARKRHSFEDLRIFACPFDSVREEEDEIRSYTLHVLGAILRTSFRFRSISMTPT